jgi:hypothetical protein
VAPSTSTAGEHHRRQADAAAAVHGDPVAGPDAAHRGERGHEAAAEARRLDEAEVLGEPHEVQVRARERDQLGERAPGREAGLEVLVAELRLAVAARVAPPAAAAERDRHAVADGEAVHLGAALRDHSGQLVPRHVR